MKQNNKKMKQNNDNQQKQINKNHKKYIKKMIDQSDNKIITQTKTYQLLNKTQIDEQRKDKQKEINKEFLQGNIETTIGNNALNKIKTQEQDKIQEDKIKYMINQFKNIKEQEKNITQGIQKDKIKQMKQQLIQKLKQEMNRLEQSKRIKTKQLSYQLNILYEKQSDQKLLIDRKFQMNKQYFTLKEQELEINQSIKQLSIQSIQSQNNQSSIQPTKSLNNYPSIQPAKSLNQYLFSLHDQKIYNPIQQSNRIQLSQQLIYKSKETKSQLQDYEQKLQSIDQQLDNCFKSIKIIRQNIQDIYTQIEYIRDKSSILQNQLQYLIFSSDTDND